MHLSVISFIASVYYFYIGFGAYQSNKTSKLCRIFFCLTLSMTVWSFAWGFLYLSENEVEYSFWNKLSAFGWCTFEALVLYFTMLFTENKWIKYWYIKLLVLLPAPIFLYMVLFLFGPGINTSPLVEHIFYHGNFLYNFFYPLISMFLLLLWGKRTKSKIQKRQAEIILFCGMTSFLLTFLLQDVFNILDFYDLPDMGQIFTLIMLAGVNYAIRKYQFMSIPTTLITQELFNELTGLTFLVDAQGFVIKANRQVNILLGYTAAEIVGKHVNSIINREELHTTIGCCESFQAQRKLEDIEIISKMGIRIPFNFTVIPLKVKQDLLLGFLVIGEDIRTTRSLQDEIQKHKMTNEKLKNSEELFRSILEIAPISIILTSKLTGRIIYLNTRAAEVFHSQESELIGSDISEYLIAPEDKQLFMDGIKNGEEIHKKEITIKRQDGSLFIGLLTMFPSIYHEEEVSLTCVIDITEQKRVEETLKQKNENIKKLNKELVVMNNILVNKSIKDGLTNLFNYQYMMEVLEMNIRDVTRTKGALSVMMLDIDSFKRVNDSFGHPVGDKVLVSVADLIMRNTRVSDYIGRYGGEEFIVVLPNTNLEEAENIAERIRSSIQNYDFGLDRMKVTISIGVSQYKNESPEALIKRADMLLYQAKNNGKNRVEYQLREVPGDK